MIDYKEYFQQGTSQEGAGIVLNPYISANSDPTIAPIDKIQEFHDSQHRIRALFGGNQSSKTTSTVYDDLLKAAKNPESKILIATNTRDMIGRFIYPVIQTYLPQEYIKEIAWTNKVKNVFSLIRLTNGSELHAGSYDQGRERFQGFAFDRVHFDEEAPHDIYIECMRGVISRSGDFVMGMTPLKGLTWTYDDIYERQGIDPHIACWHLNFLENRFVSQEDKDFWLSVLSADEIEKRIYGHFMRLEGAVFKEFDPRVHVVEPFPIPFHWKKYHVIDFGYNAPFVCLWIAFDPYNNAYVYQEHYQKGWLTKAHAKKIFEMDFEGMTLLPDKWVPDYEGFCDWDAQTREDLCDAYFELGHGLNLSPANKENQRENIERANRWFKAGRYKIFRNCENTIRECKGWHYKEAGKDKNETEVPVEKDDHTCDLILYFPAGVDSTEHVPTFTGAGQRTPMSSELQI
jgi:phage terminase large subunit